MTKGTTEILDFIDGREQAGEVCLPRSVPASIT